MPDHSCTQLLAYMHRTATPCRCMFGISMFACCWLLFTCAVQDFYSKECWAHHPKPYADFLEFKKKERAELEAERKKLVRV